MQKYIIFKKMILSLISQFSMMHKWIIMVGN